MSARRSLVGGNWKMHLLAGEAESFCRRLVPALAPGAAEVVLFPSFPLLSLVAGLLDPGPASCGAQDLHPREQGAHTGDVSGRQIVDAGCRWVLCGHSERRRDHGESDELVGEKVAAARRAGLLPLLCVGETAAERRAGATFEVLERQLAAGLAGNPDAFDVAYEPVWAIGTGETATPELAQEVHSFLRRLLIDRLGESSGTGRRILYGGSVKAANAGALIAAQDIDGFLVGGASLDPDEFLAIIRACGG